MIQDLRMNPSLTQVHPSIFLKFISVPKAWHFKFQIIWISCSSFPLLIFDINRVKNNCACNATRHEAWLLRSNYTLLGWTKKLLKELKVLVRSVRTSHECNFQDMWKWKSTRPTTRVLFYFYPFICCKGNESAQF